MSKKNNIQTACILVAHPDDETLWAGGTILLHPFRKWEVYTLCRASDTERSKRFSRALAELDAGGSMADLDDGPEQDPLSEEKLRSTILAFTADRRYDLVITHGPDGEYTRHRRHEETSRTVCALWMEGKIFTPRLWMFAYTDRGGDNPPEAEPDAHLKTDLTDAVKREKYRIITQIYGFAAESWEATIMPSTEAFWCFDTPADLKAWLFRREIPK